MENVSCKLYGQYTFHVSKVFHTIGLLCGRQQTGDRREYKTAHALLMLDN